MFLLIILKQNKKIFLATGLHLLIYFIIAKRLIFEKQKKQVWDIKFIIMYKRSTKFS